MYAPNNSSFKYMRQELIELKGEIHKPTITVGYLSIPLSVIDRTSRQKISKDIDDLDRGKGQDV